MRHYGVKICVEFPAAHHIRGYEGECARPHGHNFKVEVEASSPNISDIGIALDFRDLKVMAKQLAERFDHQDLNTIAPFTDINPTAETLSKYFFDELEESIKRNPKTQTITLKRVTVWENDRCAASYGE